MEKRISGGVSNEHFMAIIKPILELIAGCDNPFFIQVHFSLKKRLKDKKYPSDLNFCVDFLFPDEAAERGESNDSIHLYTFDEEHRLKTKIEFIQQALRSQSKEDLLEYTRQATEYR